MADLPARWAPPVTHIQEILKRFSAIPGLNRPIGLVEAVLINAIITLETCFKPEDFDEETITAALLGALAAGLPWVVPAIGATVREETEVSWGHYKKTTPPKNPDADDFTEATHGADFALALRVAPDTVRVALFQAKRNSERNPEFVQIYRHGRPGTATNRQFLALRSTATAILAAVRPATTPPAHFHWVHYLAYNANGVICVPMSSFAGFPAFKNLKDSKKEMHAPIPANARSLLETLMHAVANPGCEPEGWLDLTFKQARTHLRHLRSLMPVYVADEGESANALLPGMRRFRVPVHVTPAPSSTPRPHT